MKKFVIHSRKGTTSIMEVECELVQAIEDPSIMWLPAGEYRARVLEPAALHQKIEKLVDGKKVVTLVPDVWCSHSFYSSLEEAKVQGERLVRHGFEFALRKHGTAFTEEDVQSALAAMKVVML